MSRLSTLALLLAVPPACAQSQPAAAPPLSASQAIEHLDQSATVCGVITGEHTAAGVGTLVDLGPSSPTPAFRVVIWNNDRSKVGDLPATGDICVTGMIGQAQGIAQIVLYDAKSWRLNGDPRPTAATGPARAAAALPAEPAATLPITSADAGHTSAARAEAESHRALIAEMAAPRMAPPRMATLPMAAPPAIGPPAAPVATVRIAPVATPAASATKTPDPPAASAPKTPDPPAADPGAAAAAAAADPAPAADRAAETVPAATRSSASVPGSPGYRIGPDDSLQVTVWHEPTLSGNFLVRPDGMISLVLLEDVQAAGLTPMELAAELTKRLRKFLQDPLVAVTVNAANSQKIYLIGEVQHVGPEEMATTMSPLQAIAAAGGLTPYANKKKIYILRGPAGRQQKIPFNYNNALKGKSIVSPVLQAGDTIVVH